MVWAEGAERDAEVAWDEYQRRLQQADEDLRAGRVSPAEDRDLRRRLAQAWDERLRQMGNNHY